VCLIVEEQGVVGKFQGLIGILALVGMNVAASEVTAEVKGEVTAASVVPSTSDWPSYGNDPGSSKYVPLDQIDASNVHDLRVAWIWESPDNELVRADRKRTPIGFKSTPIKIDDTLYISTSLGHVAALDAATGQPGWVFESKSYEAGRPTNLGFNHRGVGFWRNEGKSRVLMPTNDARLWSLDAKTGRPDPAFGENGVVDLTVGLGREIDRKRYSVISAPMVVGDTVVVGSSIWDAPRQKEAPPGHVRGFDIRTGEQSWMFHTIPQKGEVGVQTWENDSWVYTGGTNVWTLMSSDPETGYVYLPTGTPTNDWYGGERLGDNLFAESLICVDGQTGERVWHFQTVHHGLWDYDLPAAPNLVDIVVNGKPIKAVAQVSKQAFIYVFDRLTGEPVWPIEERPVPQTSVPGERTTPTQPFPTRPAAFDLQGISDETLIDLTPELKAEAWEIVKQFEYGPIFTPPSLRGTINLPGWGGGAEWTGAAVDPETGIIYIPSRTGPMVVKLSKGDPEKTEFDYVRTRGVSSIQGPRGLPLTKPPFSRITAIDLNSGDHLWMVPFGDGLRQTIIDKGFVDPGPVGGSFPQGPLLTRTLLFVAEGGRRNTDWRLRVFNKATGAQIAAIALPGAPTGTPMSYMEGGKQFIVLATGYADAARLVALSLPD
jgi:quinoprotein glucose dehydrogenase